MYFIFEKRAKLDCLIVVFSFKFVSVKIVQSIDFFFPFSKHFIKLKVGTKALENYYCYQDLHHRKALLLKGLLLQVYV